MRVLILDNYDSFTFNLHQYVGALGATSQVEKNDALDLAGVEALAPDRIPILGVYLGHQGIVDRFGGRVVRAPQVMHGKTSRSGTPGRASSPGSSRTSR